MPVNRTTFESLDKARLENYLRDILKDPEVPETRESWIVRLKALGFMTDGITEEPVCTIAGLNLFGIKPRQTLKQSGVRLMFFDTPDKEYQALLDKVFDAPLVGRFQVGKSGTILIDAGLIEKCLETMEPFVTQEPNHIDENFRREKKWIYPFEAIRELLINALAHRDWTRFVDVEIAGYKDRLEIISPGALPNAMTVEKMVAGQRSARNLIIVEVLRDYGYVDARGMGVRTKVIPALKAAGLEPIFHATDDYVKTLLRKAEKHLDKENAPANASLEEKKTVPGAQKVQKLGKDASINAPLTSFQVQLVAGIEENPSTSYDALAETLNKNRTTVMRNIQKLKEMGVLKRIGSKKTGYWEVIGEAEFVSLKAMKARHNS